MPPGPRINILLFCHSRQAPPACRTSLLRLICVTKVTLLIRMWNVDQSYMTIILKLKNCGTNHVTHEEFAECGKIHGMRDNHAKCVTGGNPTL